MKIPVQRHSPSNLTELERICRENGRNPNTGEPSVLASYQRRLDAVIAGIGVSTKY
jgi:hypothetical protein